LVDDAVAVVRGERIAPAAMAAKLQRRFALLGVTGVARMALSALDMALWDALAVAAGVPLAVLLGGAPRPIRAYNSSGLGLMAPQAVADEAEALLEGGLQAVKLRLGHPTLAEDLAVAPRRPCAAAGPHRDGRLQPGALAHRGAGPRPRPGVGRPGWLEEPIRHDDWSGNAEIARELRLPLQLGENFNGPQAMLLALQHRPATW
jgi:mandelate racemase